jgi:hypothetical protein
LLAILLLAWGDALNVAIMLHNFSHIAVPFIIIGIVLFSNPHLDLRALLFTTFFGAFFPDVDHFYMWKKIEHTGFFSFVKSVMRAERYRRAFLLFHNHLTILIVAVALPILALVNFFWGIFLLAFLAHLVLDYLADVLLIKTHSHWKFRNWL